MKLYSALLRLKREQRGLDKRTGFGKMPTAKTDWHYSCFPCKGKEIFLGGYDAESSTEEKWVKSCHCYSPQRRNLFCGSVNPGATGKEAGISCALSFSWQRERIVDCILEINLKLDVPVWWLWPLVYIKSYTDLSFPPCFWVIMAARHIFCYEYVWYSKRVETFRVLTLKGL